MFTTFGSFRKAGACRSGNQRFLRVIGNSSTHLSGLDAKIPVWVPLIMNPNNSEDIGWMFNSALTFEHDADDFRHLFDRTRNMVFRCGLFHFLCSLHMRYTSSPVWDFATGNHAYTIKVNKKKAQALIDMAQQVTRLLRQEVPKTDDEFRAAFIAMERICGTHLEPATHDPASITPPNGAGRLDVNENMMNYLWIPFRMAAMEDDKGEIRASIRDQLYYSHFTLLNVFALAQWETGIGIEFNKHPGPKNEKIKAPGAVPTKRSGEMSRSYAKRLNEYKMLVAEYESYQATLKSEKGPSDADPLDNLTQIWRHPALFGFKTFFIGAKAEIQTPQPASKTKRKSKSKAPAAPPPPFIRLHDEELDEDDDGEVEMLSESEENIFATYDREYVESKRRAAELESDKANYVYDDDGKAKLDAHRRHILDSRSYIWSNDDRWLIDWVHMNFDTHAFFSTLRSKDENPLPESVTPEWLAQQTSMISTHVKRDEKGEFIAGMIAIQSPRVLLNVMKTLAEMQANSTDFDLTPARRTFRERMIAAAQEANREALDELATSGSEPEPVVPQADEIPRSNAPSPAPIVQLADAVFGSTRRRRQSA